MPWSGWRDRAVNQLEAGALGGDFAPDSEPLSFVSIAIFYNYVIIFFLITLCFQNGKKGKIVGLAWMMCCWGRFSIPLY
jgi:hypothetical protein